MTARSSIELSSEERAAVYLCERMKSLRESIQAAEKAVDNGLGEMIVPFVDRSFRAHLEQLRAEMADAEADLTFLNQSRGPRQ